MALILTCLSQKGGVGKSTLARLIARTYANGGWTVKICDFNTKQKTSVDWVAVRMANGIEPEIHAEPYASVRNLKRESYDLLVVDGRPDSDQTSLEAARIADLNIIPTGQSVDDLRPQILFANELTAKGVDRERILFVLNQTTDSFVKPRQAREYIKQAGYRVVEPDLPMKTTYQNAQDIGGAVSETKVPSLDSRAEEVASAVIGRVQELERGDAA